MEDKGFLIYAGIVFVTALAFVLGFYLITKKNEAQAKPAIVKITANSSVDRVNGFFKNRTKVTKASDDIVWTLKDSELSQRDIYLGTGAKTAVQKAQVRKLFIKEGGKIIHRVCYNLYSKDKSWSMGYCTNSDITEVS